MKIHGSRWAVVCISLAVMAAPVAFAQQQQQSNQNQYEGVSHPPPNDTIVASDLYAPPPPPQVKRIAKPSAAVPATAAVQPVRAAAPASVNSGLPYANTDYGIVTVPLTPQQVANENALPNSTPGSTAVLHTRPNYSNLDIVTTTQGANYALPVGAEIHIRLNQELSTNSTAVDTPFQGQVVTDVMNGGSVVIPAGSTLKGFVSGVSQGHHLGTAATLRLDPQIVILPDGTAYHIDAQVVNSEAAGTRTGSEGGIKPSAHLLKKSAEYGVGVGTGAMVGAELAGPAGALAGGLIGAGMITTHLFLQQPQAATVPAGSQIIFGLTEPMYLTPTQN